MGYMFLAIGSGVKSDLYPSESDLTYLVPVSDDFPDFNTDRKPDYYWWVTLGLKWQ